LQEEVVAEGYIVVYIQAEVVEVRVVIVLMVLKTTQLQQEPIQSQ
jgi:hypothetical protein